jgi:hypothetical protein
MILLGEVLVDEALLRERFVCRLDACHGACCVAGDAGAPLEQDEVPVLEQLYPKVAHRLTAEGRAAVEAQGAAVRGDDGTWETPLTRPGGPCAYVVWEGPVAKCAIEQAHAAGEIDYQKPISCHLYPIRVHRTGQFELMRYDRWDVCAPACANGRALGVPVYEFLRAAIERRFGAEFYAELHALAVARRDAKEARSRMSESD